MSPLRHTGRVVVVLVVLIAAVATYVWWPSETRAIEHRLDLLASMLSLSEHEPEFARVTRVAQLRGFLHPGLRVRAGQAEIVSRDAILALVGQWTPPAGGVTVEFADVQVTLTDGAPDASVYLTVKISSRDARTGEPTLDAREANLVMTKLDGVWVVLSAETADTLARP